MTFRVMRHHRRKKRQSTSTGVSLRQRARSRALTWSGFLMAILVIIVNRVKNPNASTGRLLVVFTCFLAACIIVSWVGKRLK